ncbi:MAG: hypothetical protein MUC49_06305 [Raineya sp.]|nr:hypothetical protein [Raineya sp.]
MKKHFYTILFLQAIVMGTAYAQYQSKTVKVKTEEYEGTVEDPSKTYKWIKAGKLGESKGSFQGELIHGKVELFTMGMGGEKEMVEKGTYFAGLKDGKIEEYTFGNLENVETYDKGELKEIEFYHPEKKVIDHKIVYNSPSNTNPRKMKITFYYVADHLDADKKPTGKKLGGRLEFEGYQIPNGSTYSNFYDGVYKKYTTWQDVETLRQEGVYSKNRRTGEWKTYYDDGVVGNVQYDNDLVISEKFSKGGQPFTGVVKEMSRSLKSEVATFEVKNGVRDGKSSDVFRQNDKKEWLPTRIVEYSNGKAKDENFDFAGFLKSQKILKDAAYTQECDSKGSGLLFLDKIQYTDKGALVYFQTVNTTFVNGSAISTAAPGAEGGFTAYDLNTKKTYKVTKIFNIAVKPASQSSAYGEMATFILYFEGLTQTVKKISFVEGDPENPFVVDEKTGNTTYNWGCYELITK